MGNRTQLLLVAFCLSAVLLELAVAKEIKKRSEEEEEEEEEAHGEVYYIWYRSVGALVLKKETYVFGDAKYTYCMLSVFYVYVYMSTKLLSA